MTRPLVYLLALACLIVYWSPSMSQVKEDNIRVEVLVPLKAIEPYTLLDNPSLFTVLEVPRRRLREDVSDTITSFEQVRGKITRHYRLQAAEPFYKNDLLKPEEVDQGPRTGEVHQAVQFPAREVPPGLLKTGSRIDILATLPDTPLAPTTRSQCILQNLEVLLVDEKLQPGFVRLVVRANAQQALILKYYQDISKLSCVHRKPFDKTVRFGPAEAKRLVTSPRDPMQVLSRYVGQWLWKGPPLTSPLDRNNAEGKSSEGQEGTVVGRLTMKNRYAEVVTQTGGDASTWLICFNHQTYHFDAWCFHSTQPAREYRGTWDDATNTMTWKSTPLDDEQHTLTQVFTDKDSIDWTSVYRDGNGLLRRTLSGKTRRK